MLFLWKKSSYWLGLSYGGICIDVFDATFYLVTRNIMTDETTTPEVETTETPEVATPEVPEEETPVAAEEVAAE